MAHISVNYNAVMLRWAVRPACVLSGNAKPLYSTTSQSQPSTDICSPAVLSTMLQHPCMHSHTADVVTASLYAASCVPF